MNKSHLAGAMFAFALVAHQMPSQAADLASGVQPVSAIPPARIVEDRWTFNVTPYFWMATLGGQTVAGDDINMPFNDVIQNLNFALMTSIAAEKGRFGLYSDLIYMNLEGSKTSTANLVGRSFKTKLNAKVQGFVTTNTAGYKVIDTPGTEISGVGGFRYLWLQSDLDFSLGGFNASTSGQGQVIDAVVGLRGETQLSEKWSLGYYGDVGAGQSDVTWQLYGAIGYEVRNVDLFAGYRYMGWRFDDVADLDEFDIHGPVIGARFQF